jgi:hypothetical protein
LGKVQYGILINKKKQRKVVGVCIARANEWEEPGPFGHRVQASPIEKTPCWEQLIEIFMVDGRMSAVDIRCGSNALFSSPSPFSLFSLVKYNGIFYFF